jgi:dynein heavy chain
MENSSPKKPIIIVLSPGVDPTDQLKRLAEDKGILFETISMGKGQAQRAEQILT